MTSYDVEFSKDRRLLIMEEYGIWEANYIGCEILLYLEPCFVSGHHSNRVWIYLTKNGREVRLCEKCHQMALKFQTT